MNKPLPRVKYLKHIESLVGKCAFCVDQNDFTIKKFLYWDWVFAAFPYRKYHTMLIPRRHIINFFELTEDELLEFRSIIKQVENIYKKALIVSKESLYGDQMYYAWRTRILTDGKESLSHFHLHICPKFEKETSIILTDDAWDIDMSDIKKFI